MTDPLIAAARFLTAQLPWLRWATDEQGTPRAADVFREIGDCAARMRGLMDGPREQKYLGPCGAETQELSHADPYLPTNLITVTCEGDVYGVAGAQTGRCRTCGATVDQAERRQWLDDEVRARAFTAKDIADAYGINVKTIRSWATERQARWDHSGTLVQPARPAKLRSYWRTEAGLTVEWVDPVLDPSLKGDELKARLGEISDEVQARGGRLHYVGDVLDLAAADAARREERRVERERRAARREGATA